MKKLIDDEVVSYFQGDNSLLDGSIQRIDISRNEEDKVNIELYFEMRRSSEYRNSIVRFSDCKEYSFSYTDDYYFYSVEAFKLFKTGSSKYYASFDPCDESECVSEEDRDVIFSKSISVQLS